MAEPNSALHNQKLDPNTLQYTVQVQLLKMDDVTATSGNTPLQLFAYTTEPAMYTPLIRC